jgi:hypothetical protein
VQARGVEDDKEVNDELGDLHGGEVLLPLEVVSEVVLVLALKTATLTQILAPPAVA